jgi:stringent starvation protein B
VKNNEIVLNIGFEATTALKLGNETIEFKARFGGTSREIVVPVDHVIAIYARENGQGMAFPVPSDAASAAPTAPGDAAAPARSTRLSLAEAGDGDRQDPEPEPPSGGRPTLKRIK